jgi:hypothetical protein
MHNWNTYKAPSPLSAPLSGSHPPPTWWTASGSLIRPSTASGLGQSRSSSFDRRNPALTVPVEVRLLEAHARPNSTQQRSST